MKTLLSFDWSKFGIWIFGMAVIGMAIVVFTWLVEELNKNKFNMNYEALKQFIFDESTEVTKENYDAIYDMFTDTYCYSDEHQMLIKKLWSDFQYKFRAVSPVIETDDVHERILMLNQNKV